MSELYRIRRALWRFWFLGQLASRKTLDAVKYPDDAAYMMFPFIRSVTAWEMEETECVYYFVRDEYGMRRVQSQTAYVSDHTPLIQRLLLLLGYKSSDIAPTTLDLEFTHNGGEPLAKAAFGCRVAHSGPINILWSDAPPSVYKANPGYAFYEKSVYSRFDMDDLVGRIDGIFSDSYFERQPPLLCCLKWGYCIWDRARLARWGMLSYEVRDGLDWMMRWSRGDSGGVLCIHNKCQEKALGHGLLEG